jgi:hypothetical protein
MARNPRLVAALEFAGIKLCQDSSCIFGSAPGMHTNGGCRCADRTWPPEARMFIQRMARAMRNLVEDPS